MRHQILGLRDFIKDGVTKKYDAFFERGWRFDDLKECFQNPAPLLADIPNEERYNLYFTVGKCVGKREVHEQKYIPFDIDHVDQTRIDETLETALQALGLRREDTLSLFSGNGIQFFVELEEAFTDTGVFDLQRADYKACCLRIASCLDKAKLPGKVDTSVWSDGRLMRMPDTLNVKPHGSRMSYAINKESRPIKFDLAIASGTPKITKEDQLAKWPPPDTRAVLEGCLNLRAMCSEPESISEPLWYGCASIVGRLGGNEVEGRRIWHEYSSKYSRYSASEADSKLTQALGASGPRTCENFSSLPGSRCGECPHFGKLKSPILIIGKDYIKTRETGFHSLVPDGEGGLKLGPPNYEDLRKYFEQQHPYVVNADAGAVFTYRESHYEMYPELLVKGFAQENFQKCDNKKATEFASLVKRTNLKLPKWFADTTEYKMNFKNGVLDVKTGEFTDGPSRDIGFFFTLGFDYDRTATAPVFTRFLDEITCGDNELKRLLLEFGGYALSNDEYWEHKALLLVGDGSNGKNTFVQVLKDLAGTGYSSVAMKNLSNEQHLARLEGKLFNFSEEASVKAFYDTDAFKTICSGGEINVKTVYQKPYDIVNRAKIIIACNDIPESRDTSFGFFRRFAIAPFNATFTERNRDVHISRRLRAERAGILNLLLDAYREMKERGHLVAPKAGAAKLQEYKLANDPFLQWFGDIQIGPCAEQVFTKNEDLYNSYASHCQVDGAKPVSRVQFFLRLSKLVPESINRRQIRKVGGKTERVWLGVSMENGGAF